MRLLTILLLAVAVQAADLRVGIIGTDISHVIHFTRILNNAADPDHIAGARVVAAHKGGSPDIVSSRKRVDGFAEELTKVYGVELVPDIPALCARVDAIFLESGDGPIHLEQARPVIAAHKPLFIDNP